MKKLTLPKPVSFITILILNFTITLIIFAGTVFAYNAIFEATILDDAGQSRPLFGTGEYYCTINSTSCRDGFGNPDDHLCCQGEYSGYCGGICSLYCSEGYLEDIFSISPAKCCNYWEYWDGEACSNTPSTPECSSGWRDTFETLDLVNNWFRFYNHMDPYSTYVSTDTELDMYGFKTASPEVPEYTANLGSDFLSSRKYIGDSLTQEIVISWKMKANAVSNAVLHITDKSGQDRIRVMKAGNYEFSGGKFNIIVLEENRLICQGAGCFKTGITFGPIELYDEYILRINVPEKKYRISFNGIDLSFNNNLWREYSGLHDLSSLLVLFSGNANFNSFMSVSFDDFSASGGICDGCTTILNQVCVPTSLPEPADEPACEDDSSSICCPDTRHCVIFDTETNSRVCVSSDAYNYEVDDTNIGDLSMNLRITCEYDDINDYGVWCPAGFEFNSIMQKCVPAYNVCDAGFLPEDGYEPSLTCSDWIGPGANDYNPACVYSEIPPDDLWDSCCCYVDEYRGYYFHSAQNITVYNPPKIDEN